MELILHLCFVVVIAIAYGADLNAMTYLGMMGLMDPPRNGVQDAIRALHESGVAVKMLTGDARETAVSIGDSLCFFFLSVFLAPATLQSFDLDCFIVSGKMLGLRNDSSITLSGEQIESMDSYDLDSVINDVSLLAATQLAGFFVFEHAFF